MELTGYTYEAAARATPPSLGRLDVRPASVQCPVNIRSTKARPFGSASGQPNQTRGCDVRACRVKITNFRGIQSATLLLPKHGVLIGDNNTGKTTIFEALDLVLGVDRLNRQPAVDEHDFFRGK